MAQLPRIDNKYIDELYDVKAEQQTAPHNVYVGSLDVSFGGFVTPEEFVKLVQDRIEFYKEAHGEGLILDFEDSYYDTNSDIRVYRIDQRIETKTETYERLKKVERQKRALQQTIEGAIEVLKNDFDIIPKVSK